MKAEPLGDRNPFANRPAGGEPCLRNQSIRITAVSLGGIAGLLYATTVYPGIGGTLDSPELQIVGKVLGISHPTGYPLYCLLTRLLVGFPVGTLALRVSLFSALCMALAVSLLWVTAYRLSGGLPASLGAAVWFMVSPAVWRVGTVTMVYGMQTLILALILFFFFHHLRHRDSRSAGVTAFLLGVGFTHHLMTSVLLLGIFFYWFLFTPSPFSLPKRWKEYWVLFVIPLALCLYIPLRAAAGADSFDFYQFKSLKDWLLFGLGGTNTGLLRLDSAWFLREGFKLGVVNFLYQFGLFPTLVAVIGGYEWLHRRPRESALLFWLLFVHTGLAGIWTEANREAITLPAVYSASLLFAVGGTTLLSSLAAWAGNGRSLAYLFLLFFLGETGTMTFSTWREIDQRNRSGEQGIYEKVYQVLPPKSVVLSSYWEHANLWRYLIGSGEYEAKQIRAYRWNDRRARAAFQQIPLYFQGKAPFGNDALPPNPSRRFFALDPPPAAAIPSELQLIAIPMAGERCIYEVRTANAEMKAGEQSVSLLSLPWNSCNWTWHEPVVNHTLLGNPLKIHSANFQEGLGVHGGTKIQIPVPPNAVLFTAVVGAADDLPPVSPVSVRFIVWASDRPPVTSPVLRRPDPPYELRCSILNESSLILEISGTEDGLNSDHAVIAEPRFILQTHPAR